MLAYNHVPQQYFKPLNIQTGIEYSIDTEKFPGLTNTGHEPTLVVAQTEMETPKVSPEVCRLVPVKPTELPSSQPERQSPETITACDPFRDFFAPNIENMPYPNNQKDFQHHEMSKCQSMINQLPGDNEFQHFENDSQVAKPAPQVYSEPHSSGSIHSTTSQSIQRRLSYGQTEQTESNGQKCLVEVDRNAPIPSYPKALNRKHQLQTDLIPSTVLSCLDPFDDSMSRLRTDGTISAVSTPVSTTPEYPGSSTNLHYQNLNTSYPPSQNGHTQMFANGSQDHRPEPNLPAMVQPSFSQNYSTSDNNTAIANNRGFCEKYGLPNALFTGPTDQLFRPDRMAIPKKHLPFQRPQPFIINPRVLAARRQRQILSRKRSADHMHEFSENNKRPRRDHIEVYGVEGSIHQTPASQQFPSNAGQFPTPPDVMPEDKPVESFDEYCCPARPKYETPNPIKRGHTGTIHYYGATQSSANPLAKRFNPNFVQHNATRRNAVNHPIPEVNHLAPGAYCSQLDASWADQAYNNPLSTNLCNYSNDGPQQNPQVSMRPVNCPSQNIPMNACVTKDTFLDILYAN